MQGKAVVEVSGLGETDNGMGFVGMGVVSGKGRVRNGVVWYRTE